MNDEALLLARLNAETARIEWPELERHFARGTLLKVASSLDLIEVAASMVRDDGKSVRGWMTDGALAKATEHDARGWVARQPSFWAVVVAPWVLVQEIRNGNG
ncbi:DUF2288 domain-containing protein [Acidihalobacter prosperus]